MIVERLSRPLPKLTRSPRPVNVFELVGQTRSEGAADRILAYFLEPSERHGLGSLVIDALLATLDGAPLLGREGRRKETLNSSQLQATTGWVVQRQVRASSVDDVDRTALGWSGIIDLYLTHQELGVAIIVENKIDAVLSNPLASYANHALGEGYELVVLAVLAPYEHDLNSDQARWVSRPITYSALLGEVEAGLPTFLASDEALYDEDTSRSLAILHQFIEVRKDTTVAQDYNAEAQYINEFRAVRADNSRQIDEILDAVQEVNQFTKARSKRLEPLLRERLDTAGLQTGWEAHGASSERWPLAWNAYQFAETDISVELLMSQNPRFDEPIFIKAYPGRTYKLFPDLDNVPLGTDWSSTDEEIADAFVARVLDVLKSHRI